MSVDRKAWGWCPSVLRPMPLEDGLMVRIRVPGGVLSAAQADGLAGLAERFGAGFIELTNRANLQLRGLDAADHAVLLSELDALGLTQIDRTPSGRVNITQSPFRDPGATQVAHDLATELAAAAFEALPQKFGFVTDLGARRVLADVPGDVRIESSDAGVIVRADGCETGRVTVDPVGSALDLARWFMASGLIGADGRGRLADHSAVVPEVWRGQARPKENTSVDTSRPEWLRATGDRLAPETLRGALTPPVKTLRVTPFRALYLPELAPTAPQDNKAETAKEGDGAHAV